MTGRYLQAGEEGSWASMLQVAQDGNDFLVCPFFFLMVFSNSEFCYIYSQ